MPTGYFEPPTAAPFNRSVTGKPRRDRSKNKAARKARRRNR